MTVTKGLAPSGTAPGSVVNAMYSDANANKTDGVYSNKNIAVATRLPAIKWETITTKAKTWALMLRESPQNPHGSIANHRLDSKDVPSRAPHKSLRPAMLSSEVIKRSC